MNEREWRFITFQDQCSSCIVARCISRDRDWEKEHGAWVDSLGDYNDNDNARCFIYIYFFFSVLSSLSVERIVRIVIISVAVSSPFRQGPAADGCTECGNLSLLFFHHICVVVVPFAVCFVFTVRQFIISTSLVRLRQWLVVQWPTAAHAIFRSSVALARYLRQRVCHTNRKNGRNKDMNRTEKCI